MSTRSLVGVLRGDDLVEYIYCHFDGYVDGGVGEALALAYNNEAMINELIKEGDHSCIGLGKRESYRSRGETDVDARYISLEGYQNLVHFMVSEFIYLFQENEWFFKSDKSQDWQLVKECFK